MLSRHRVFIVIVVLLALSVSLFPASARQSKPTVAALASIELVIEGLGHLKGIAVDGTGAVFVSDGKAGKIFEVVADQPGVAVGGLKRPVGVTLDGEGRLVFVEGGRARVLRLEEGGKMTTLASRLKHPQWIGAALDGIVYVTARGLAQREEASGDDESESEVIARVTPDGKAGVFADEFRGLQGLTVERDALVVAARGRRGDRHVVGTLYLIPIEPDGRAGPATPLVTNQFVEAAGLASDRLGARFVSAKSLAGEPWRRHVIVKVAQDGTATLFAESLEDPEGLAFGPDGSLYLADGRAGRVLRFVAPRPPVLDENPPAVISQRRVALRVRAEGGSRLTVLGGQLPVTLPVDHSGSALVSVTLHANRENHLQIFSTTTAGLGLTSAPLEVTVIHDDQPPSVELVTPKAGTLVRGTIAAEAFAVDTNGIAEVEFRLDGSFVGLDTTVPFRVNLDTKVVADGPRILSAVARDRAGNVASAAAEITVDNTPPEVAIVRPLSGSIGGGPVEVLVEARDATSGVTGVEVAVNGARLFMAEAPPYRFQFDPQGPGPYGLVASAVDRAGNRAESAPVSVALSDLTIGIREPADGARVPAGLVLVRGRVEAGGAEVGVLVNGVPGMVQGNTFAALVPVAPDITSLTAVATTTAGLDASHSVAITVSGTSAATLLVSPQTGLAPLAVTFSLLGGSPASIALDFDGNGTVDFTGPSLDGQTFAYTQPGLYFPTAVLTDPQGNRLTISAVVQVYDLLALDASLQTRWTAFKDALRRGDIEKALESLVFSERDGYRELLTALAPQLGQIEVILTDISLVSIAEERAEYQMVRVDDGVRLSYLILFTKDDDGIWRLEFF
jgi:hypothetical protein